MHKLFLPSLPEITRDGRTSVLQCVPLREIVKKNAQSLEMLYIALSTCTILLLTKAYDYSSHSSRRDSGRSVRAALAVDYIESGDYAAERAMTLIDRPGLTGIRGENRPCRKLI